jgi:hypothetical protein
LGAGAGAWSGAAKVEPTAVMIDITPGGLSAAARLRSAAPGRLTLR